MHKGKATGIAGHTTDFLMSGSDMLLPYLTPLFNRMFSGDYPSRVSTGISHPILKSGDANDPNNYRGIMVCNSISNFYATLLDDRIQTWAESNYTLAQGQSGVRCGRGTMDNVFILKMMLDQRHQNAHRTRSISHRNCTHASLSLRRPLIQFHVPFYGRC
jgi:hypothetical protein